MSHPAATQGTGLTLLVVFTLVALMVFAMVRWPKGFLDGVIAFLALSLIALPIVGLAMLAGWVK